ncbi:uncharacterized protein LOC123527317 [Mercenaria mercenaria]|uniref:uncharacterized protein LOC123527317 n=1 Tax=Mercenaria mercenaria TaxID=6596 RepID=UPI001E1DB499|nr:uncharacterized protein LOC123527317 [Mercenaria mercenaria]
MLSAENFKDLEEKGYTVVKNVLSKQECDAAIADYRAWLANFGDKFPKSFNSIIKDHNTGHMEVTWRLRLKAKPVFAQIWKTEKLLTSFDAVSIGRPPESGGEEFQDPRKYWLHVDYTPSRIGLHAYQGSLFLEEQTKNDWTFQVMEGSHRLIEEFFRKFPEKAEDSRRFRHNYRLDSEDIDYFKKCKCRLTRVPVPKGGMVLWDSRLIHANARPLPNRKNAGRWRFVTFVSMTPAIWANDIDIKKHQEAYTAPKMTLHWSSQGIHLLETSSSPGIPCPTTVPDIARTEEAMQLSAMLPYDYNDGKPNGEHDLPLWKNTSNLPDEINTEKLQANGHI